MDITSLISGLGIGGIIASGLTIFLNFHLENKKISSGRAFEEKRTAYIAYLDIVSRSQTMASQEALWARTSAIERIKICGSVEVVDLLIRVTNLPPNQPRDWIDELIDAMRKDLFPMEK